MPTNETPCIKPNIYIDGTLYSDLHVVSIEDSFGSLPSKCIFEYGSNGDIDTQITLNGSSFAFKPGSRVKIVKPVGVDPAKILFLGQIMKRHDQGSDNKIVWTALDDKIFLAQIPMRGALVFDDVTNSLKFIRRFDPRMNPDGYWNCIGVNYLDKVLPVFSSKAAMGLTYQSPSTTVSPTLTAGDIVPWTPRLGLYYAWLLSQIKAVDGIDGITSDEWRSIGTSSRIIWDYDTITNLKGTDVGDTSTDPLDRKLPDLQLRGNRLLGSLSMMLDASATHDLQLYYNTDTELSEIQFQPISYSALTSPGGNTPTINLLRGGNANTCDTIYDFDLTQDWSTVSEQVLVDGKIIHVETSMCLTTDLDAPFSSAKAIRPAWSQYDEASFLCGINGFALPFDLSARPRQFCRYPPIQGADYTVSPYTDWLEADGESGRPLAIARSDEAILLLRQHFPTVYRGFEIDSQALSDARVMAGYADIYGDTAVYPVLAYSRPILPKQKQFFLKNPSGGTAITNWLKSEYPIRVRLKQNSGKYTDCAIEVHAKIQGTGIIFLDGIQNELNGKNDCVYNGDLLTEPVDIVYIDQTDGSLYQSRLKNIVLNAVVPLDHRVMGTATRSGTSQFSDDFNAQCGGVPMTYVDSPNAYAEDHQVNSQPGSITSFYGGTSGTTLVTAPLDRLLPPGTDAMYSTYAAQRRLLADQSPQTAGVFRMIGIRDDIRAGMFMGYITTVNGTETDDNYLINSPIRSVILDFLNQITILGGVSNAITGI